MKVCHDEKTNCDSDDTKKFDMVIGINTVGDIVGDLLIKNDTGATCGENNETNDECAKTK